MKGRYGKKVGESCRVDNVILNVVVGEGIIRL